MILVYLRRYAVSQHDIGGMKSVLLKTFCRSESTSAPLCCRAVALSRCRWDSVDGGLSLTFTIYSVGKVLQEPRIAPWRSQKNLQTLKKLQLRAQMLPVTNILGVNQFAT